MNRIPKFTSGMFKKKVKRFGAASPKMPRMPKPRMKKFQRGGDVDDLVPRKSLPSENAAELAARARKEDKAIEEAMKGTTKGGPPRRYTKLTPKKKTANKPAVDRYKPTEIVLDGTEEAREQAEFERRLKELEDRRKAERQKREYEEYERSRMPRVITARSGGEIKKYRKGGSIDGCATKGKTRGKYI